MTNESKYSDRPKGAGPDGSNLLGFLSAVGALVTCTNIFRNKRVTLHWEQSLGWRGRVLIDGEALTTDQIEKIHEDLTSESNLTRFTLQQTNGNKPYPTITKIDPVDATNYLKESIKKGMSERFRYSDTFSGWFSDLPDDKNGKFASSTQLCALTGGSQQYFLKTALDLSGFNNQQLSTTVDHLKQTLLDVWKFRESRPGCRWDAQEKRYHALRHRDPKEKHKGDRQSPYNGLICTQRGANRLGIEALSVFPLIPTVRRVETPGFSYSTQEKLHCFTWPVWGDKLSLDVLRTLIAHRELTRERPNLKELQPLGVVELFRCRRFTTKNGQVSFSVSKPVNYTV